MSAEIAEAQPVEPLTLTLEEAGRVAAAVRDIQAAARRVLSGGRHLDADDVKTLRRAAIRAYMVTCEAAEHQHGTVVDLAAERRRRR